MSDTFLKETFDGSNSIYTLNVNSKIYRADDKKNKLNEYKPRFFGYIKEDVKSYGAIVYEFQVNTTLKLLALDKNIKSFYNEAPDDIKEILRNQYGYNSESKEPIRDSFSPNDNKLLDYLCSTKKYDGYATNLMEKVDNFDGLFPREIVICDSEKYNTPVIISEITDEQKERLQQDANLLEYTKREKMSRKKKRPLTLQSKHKVGKFSLGDDDDDEENVFNVSKKISFFGEDENSSPLSKNIRGPSLLDGTDSNDSHVFKKLSFGGKSRKKGRKYLKKTKKHKNIRTQKKKNMKKKKTKTMKK